MIVMSLISSGDDSGEDNSTKVSYDEELHEELVSLVASYKDDHSSRLYILLPQPRSTSTLNQKELKNTSRIRAKTMPIKLNDLPIVQPKTMSTPIKLTCPEFN